MTNLGKGIKRNYRVECIDKNTFKATALLYYTDALHNTEYSFNEKETITINKEKVTILYSSEINKEKHNNLEFNTIFPKYQRDIIKRRVKASFKIINGLY